MSGNEISPPGKPSAPSGDHPVASAIDEIYGARGRAGTTGRTADVAAPVTAPDKQEAQLKEANDPSTSPERLAQLPERIKYLAAKTGQATTEALDVFSRSRDATVLEAVASNPNASEAALVRTASFRGGDFRNILMSVEANPNQTDAVRAASKAGRDAWENMPAGERPIQRRRGQASVGREMRLSEGRGAGEAAGKFTSLAIVVGAGLELFDSTKQGNSQYVLPEFESGK